MKAGDTSLIESFLEMMSAELGASINTLSAYRRDLLDFSVHLSTKAGSMRSATRDDIKAYLAFLSRSGVSGSTQARRLSALRPLYLFLYSEEGRGDAPTHATAAPRRVRPLPRTLSHDDMNALIAAAHDVAAKS